MINAIAVSLADLTLHHPGKLQGIGNGCEREDTEQAWRAHISELLLFGRILGAESALGCNDANFHFR